MEPTSAAASGVARAVSAAVTKKMTSHTGVRLGGREERRQVYSRFQAATVEAISFAELLRVEGRLTGPFTGYRRIRELGLQAHERKVELMAAYFELRLVANPAPLEKGEAAMVKASQVLEEPGSRGEAQFRAKLEAAVEAQREFTDECRDDLWYLPQRWQVHRRIARRWKARRARR
ncbi:hypothetical protein [Streptomyces neyagawaensis]|uniref:hypothetical protein n=1 Tax=Streptomyces neyagawaensis TaxID=42238 RepID=UPI0006E1FE69|nr:hypothetical protein [Streptomyces neyagawaensis]MCL6733309.1 hypothetical protein [Streptomyces neyagawaensis]MDE1685111.1 hypothetical protein [Streptomyces neyagawaensis]